jgi:hypothetical protein
MEAVAHIRSDQSYVEGHCSDISSVKYWVTICGTLSKYLDLQMVSTSFQKYANASKRMIRGNSDPIVCALYFLFLRTPVLFLT